MFFAFRILCVGGVKPRVTQTSTHVEKQQKFSEIQSNSVVCIQAERQKVPSKFCEFVSLDQIHLLKSLTFATNNICVTVWVIQSKIAPAEKKFPKISQNT